MKFPEFLILHLLEEFIPRWEDWIELNLDSRGEKEFHYTLIRLLKGQIKAWRTWKCHGG